MLCTHIIAFFCHDEHCESEYICELSEHKDVNFFFSHLESEEEVEEPEERQQTPEVVPDDSGTFYDQTVR